MKNQQTRSITEIIFFFFLPSEMMISIEKFQWKQETPYKQLKNFEPTIVPLPPSEIWPNCGLFNFTIIIISIYAPILFLKIEEEKYTEEINVVARCLVKAFIPTIKKTLTIKTNSINSLQMEINYSLGCDIDKVSLSERFFFEEELRFDTILPVDAWEILIHDVLASLVLKHNGRLMEIQGFTLIYIPDQNFRP
ncbi:hypothetical protein HAM_033 (mitochondrion) [Hemiselmis andersenii]|uniref:Uncharacterized protein n=1 Tax=Hemiselmis andersenii TaxID=464988 RepID=B2MWU0_HEMAN|nr:hypothetical protein HAM_033 [Hemiselmis andersenii]ACC78232.1 hypothetical protein HAM_033 [Hemiselmis andersenii]